MRDINVLELRSAYYKWAESYVLKLGVAWECYPKILAIESRALPAVLVS